MRCISTFYRSAQRRRQACSIPPEWMLNLSGRAAQSRAEYSNSKKQGELDFLVEQAGSVLPIEIKSGKDYTKHAALSNVLANPDYAIPEAYVFHNGNVSTAGKVAYLPIYMLMFVEKEKSEAEMIYRIDLSALQED